jgi:hypothetical protein
MEMLAIRQHMGLCAECKSEFESIMALKRSFGCLNAKHPSDYLSAQICERIHSSGLTPERSILQVVSRYFAGFSGGLRLASVCAGLLVAMVFVSKVGVPTQSMVYNPPFGNTLVQSFDERNPIRVFYVPRSAPPGALFVLPDVRPAAQRMGSGSGSPAPLTLIGLEGQSR